MQAIERKKLQRAADVRNAQIVSRNTDASWQCRDLRTQQEFRAVADTVDNYRPGLRVLVSPTGASQLAPGSGYVILRRAPQEQRGVGLVPRSQSQAGAAPFVKSISPDPVTVEASNVSSNVAATIYGGNLTAYPTAPYSKITIVPNTMTSSVVQFYIQIANDSAVGTYDLVINGITIPDAVEITPVATGALWLSRYSSPARFKTFDIGAFAASTEFDGSTGNPNIAIEDDILYALEYNILRRRRVSSGAPFTNAAVAPSSITLPLGSQLAPNGPGGTYLYIGSGNAGQIARLGRDGTGKTQLAVGSARVNACIWDDPYLWITQDGVSGLQRYNTATLALDSVAFGTTSNGFELSQDATYVYCAIGSILYRVNKSTLVADSLTIDAGASVQSSTSVVLGSRLWLSSVNAGVYTITEVDLLTFSIVATSPAVGGYVLSLAADASHVYATRTGGTALLRYDRMTMAAASSISVGGTLGTILIA